MDKIRVGVLRGGQSPEFEASIKTGADVLINLPDDKYHPVDLLITKNGVWHIDGMDTSPEEIKESVDVIFNALHGGYGENGEILNLINELEIPYTGSNTLSSNITSNKILSKKVFKSLGFKTPLHEVIEDFRKKDDEDLKEGYFKDIAENVFRKIPPPWIIKPAQGGASYDTYYADNFYDLYIALLKVAQTPGDILIEEFINGREVVVGVIDNYRGENQYTLLPNEIKKVNKIFDYGSRSEGNYDLLNLGYHEKDKKEFLEDSAKKIHKELGLEHYSSVDFLISPKGVYVLEVDSLPHLHKHSVFRKALESVGSNMSHFLDHIITLALKKK
ncbi:MAG: ATP-grasp domain-containing protein [Candidatus Paceibacterota bacterium]|jgi:D-alanine-D-alanine ligase